jgi:hypothetical protein
MNELLTFSTALWKTPKGLFQTPIPYYKYKKTAFRASGRQEKSACIADTF